MPCKLEPFQVEKLQNGDRNIVQNSGRPNRNNKTVWLISLDEDEKTISVSGIYVLCAPLLG